jgi:chemotaxis signal transduction protein
MMDISNPYSELFSYPFAGSNDFFIGVISYLGKTIGVVALHSLISGEKFVYDHTKYGVIILKITDEDKINYVGIAVDGIYDSPEIPNRSIQIYTSSLLCANVLTKAIVKPEEDINKSQMLSILDVHAIDFLHNLTFYSESSININ